ncbi:GBS Bsp-like repeat-containing protein [Streptococcus zalophi]|uniref:GBS Bsp-like repeat-containing protein n=1 Tax=Streptococcus zalophi TaxID=640031 RepID=A0A934P8N6_9STRE|nr:GBS Bsp-like repeat-containing protein [Streptococcus zalophi]MBJ8349041.1 GBS Bsp-like repeat-containing protein [Streptococcus zalophi]MCR8967808.1 GBS Bsp-like repeat-containing protein [Streptococcus zalophi]
MMLFSKKKWTLILPIATSILLYPSTVLAEDTTVQVEVPKIEEVASIEPSTDTTTTESSSATTNGLNSSQENLSSEEPISSEKLLIEESGSVDETQNFVSDGEEVDFSKENQESINNGGTIKEEEEIADRKKEAPSTSGFRAKPGSANSQVVTDVSEGTIGLRLQYQREIPQQTSILFAVWTDKNGQDDLKWYRAERGGVAYASYENHKSYGLYHVHTYANQSGRMIGLNATTITIKEPAPKAQITKVDDNHYRINVTDVPQTIKSIVVPVWSDKNGQDDLKWYQAKQLSPTQYETLINVKDHKNDFGFYHAHLYGYSEITKSLIGLMATPGFKHENKQEDLYAKISLQSYDKNKSSFNVAVDASQSTKSLRYVRVAVWSEAKGQDDLKWYTPTISNKKAIAKVDIADHSNTSDYYIVHVYTDYSDGKTIGTDLGKHYINRPQPVNKISSKLTSQGIEIKLTSDSVKDLRQIRFAVWSDEKGQDDLRWYAANANGVATANYTNHKGFGTYHIHTYLTQSGQLKGLKADKLTISKPNIKVAINKLSATNYEVVVNDVPLYINGIVTPVWSDNKGQDDLKWEKAAKISSTSYKSTIDVRNHNFDSGHYSVHIYGYNQLEANRLIGLAGSPGFNVKKVEQGKITAVVTNHKPNEGTLDVLISETPTSPKIKSVRVAAWSESKQENLSWYVSDSVKNGQIVININQANHQHKKGNYTVHAYVTNTKGQEIGFNLGNHALNSSIKGSASQGNYDVINRVVYLDAGHGGRDPGAAYFGHSEKELTTIMQNLVRQRLEKEGYKVVTTRESEDVYVDLLDRSKKSNASNSDLFLSMHFNASVNSNISGIETYMYQYYQEYPSRINKIYHNNPERLARSQVLANAIQSETVKRTGAPDRGVRRETFAVLRETTAPAVLVELGYLSNRSENNKVSQSAYQVKLADGIVAGIKRYYRTYQ